MKTKRFFTTLGLAFAMSAPILAGCGKSGGKTSSSAEDIKYIVSYVPSADYTVSGIKTEGYSVNETVSFGVAVTDAENKEVNSVRYGTTTLQLGTDNKYSFLMPEENVQLSISLKNIVKYSMTYTGSAKVDEEITITLKLGNDPVTADYTVEGKTDADKAKVTVRDGNKVKFLSEGKVTLVAKVNNEVKAELEVTAEKAAISTIKEALEAATAEMKTVANGTVSKSTWTIGGEIVSINEKVSTSDATKFNFAVIIDDGTELVSLSVYDTKEKMTHKVGDKVKAEVKFKSYYGLLQAYKPTTSGTSSFYSDQLLANDKTYTKKSATTMTAAQLDAYYATVKDNSKYNPIIPFVATGKNTKIGESMRFVYDGGNAENAGAIALVSTRSCEVNQTEGVISTVKGFLYSGNTSSKYLTAHITEQVPLAPTSVSINGKQEGVTLTLNNTAQLTYTLNPVGAAAKTVVWSSSDATTVSVSETGLVKGLKEGNATITLKVDDKLTDTIVVTVSGALNHATAIALDKTSEKVGINKTVTLTATLTGEDATKPCTDVVAWTTSDATVATVAEGVVTGLKEGTATITATANGKTATCEITVYNQCGTLEKPLSVAEALALMPATHQAFFEDGPLYVKGYVVSNGPSSASNSRPNLYIKDLGATATLQVYSCNLVDGVENPIVGDEVVVSGYLENFNNKAEITANKNVFSTIHSSARHSYNVAFTAENGQITDVTGVSENKANNGTTISFKVVANSGYKIAGVTANGDVVSENDGVYSVTVGCDDLNIVANIISNDAKTPVIVEKTTAEIFAENSYTISAGSDVHCYPNFALDSVINVATTGTANCGSFWGTNFEWRLYQNKKGDVKISSAAGYKIVSLKITFTVSNTGALKVGETIIASNTEVTVDANSWTAVVGNSGTATNGQVKITKFSVTYIEL